MKSRRSPALARALPLVLLGLLADPPALAAAHSASPACASTLDKTEAQITDDIAFAKGLAKEWGFVDLASEVIREIEREGVSVATAERLGVVKCEIYAQAALAERDRTRRNELFEQALSAYQSFLKDNPRSFAVPEARSGYITISGAFARSLEISMEEALGAEAEALRKRRMEVLLDANTRTSSLIGELKAEYESKEDKPEALKRELINVMMQQAQINLQIGISMEEGTASFNSANKILVDVVFLAGEGTPGALRAYDMIGQVNAARQNWGDAAIYFEAVIEQALPSDPAEWATMVKDMELTEADKEQRWLFLELSTGGLVNALLSGGDVAGATKYALHLYNTQRREGFSYSTQLGYPSLLAAARALLDSGGVVAGRLNDGKGFWFESHQAAIDADYKRERDRIATADLALRIAQQVVAENQGNILRVKGQQLIADITSRPGVEVDPSVLYEAAEGKYNAGQDQDSLGAFKLVLAALEGKDEAARIGLGPKTFFRMGRAYQRLERHFEAAMAFREGCTTWLGDPLHDSYNAQGYYRSMQELTRKAPGDAILSQMYQEAENLAKQFSEQDQDQILFDQAERQRRAKDYEGAIANYKQIKQSAIDYEKALVYIGVCYWRMGELDEGYSRIVDYLENVDDPLKFPSVTGAKVAKRTDARATAGFYRCLHEYGKQQYDQVIASSVRYHEDFSDQTVMAPWVMHMVGDSYSKTGLLEKAKRHLNDLISAYATSDWVATLAIDIYKDLAKQQAALIEAQGEQAARSEESLALAREMAKLIEIGNQNTSKPSFDNLRAESRLWLELGDWGKAVPVLERIVTKFGGDPEQEKSLVVYVKPDLAHAYLEQQRVAEAHAILAELVASIVSKPSKRTLLNYTRSVIGWITGNAAEIQEVPGAGQTEDAFKDACDKLNSIANSVDEKWACEWYSLKLQLAYGYYKWATAEGGPKDSRKQEAAKQQLSALVQQLGNDFKGKPGVPGVNDVCDQSAEFTGELGSDILRRRLVWLWGKVK
jgi:tetratricopeptide (TPR) repeat protein